MRIGNGNIKKIESILAVGKMLCELEMAMQKKIESILAIGKMLRELKRDNAKKIESILAVGGCCVN